MTKKHELCEACSHNRGDHDDSHDRYNKLVNLIGSSLEEKIAIQVLDALKNQSDEQFEVMLVAIIKYPWAFIEALHISINE